MSAPNTVTFTAWLKDQMTGPMEKMRVKSEAAFGKIRSSLGKISYESKTTVTSIDSINRELDKLRASRKIMVDASAIKMANKEISILEAKKHRLETVGGTSSGGGMGMMSKMGLYGLAIGAAYKGVQFMKDSVAEFNVDAQVKAQLQAGLKSTGGISGKTMTGMTSQAEELQNITLFKHSDTEAADKILLTFTKVRNEIFDKSIPLLQDMSTKMQIDLPQAALQLGKVLQDPIKGIMALRREGVVLSDEQQKQVKYFVKTNQLAKAQGIILQELQTEFGGSAKAAAKAGTGGLTILKNNFIDIKKTIGSGLMPVLGSLGKELGQMITSAKKMLEVPLSEEMQKQKIQVDSLAMSLMDHNIDADTRNQLYKDLIQIAPEFDGILTKEGLDYDKLNEKLTKYNDLTNKKIQGQKFDEGTQKLANRATEINNEIRERRDQISTEIETVKTLGILNEKYYKQTEDNYKKGKISFLDYANAMYQFIDAASTMNDNPKLAKAKIVMNADLYGTRQLDPFASKDIKNSIWGLYNDVNEENTNVLKRMKTAFETKKSLGLLETNNSDTNLDNKPVPTPLDHAVENINGDISKVKNINITIQKLIGIEGMTTTNNMTQDMSKLKDAITEVLLTAVNDANLIDS